jgi:hypothetical protein
MCSSGAVTDEVTACTHPPSPFRPYPEGIRRREGRRGEALTTTARRCPSCRAEVLTGIDDLGIDVTVDPDPILDPVHELEVILGGARTYTRHLHSDTIAHRSPGRIVAHPAGTRARVTVHAEHRCEARP